MKRFITAALCALFLMPPAHAIETNLQTPASANTTKSVERDGITYSTALVSEADLDAGRVRKQVSFRGNKSVRFAEFENLALAPQQLYAKRLLNSAAALNSQGVVNYAELPAVNPKAQAVKRVETKITQRVPNNPAITGYGRSRTDLYGALRAKRALDNRRNQKLAQKLQQFQVKAGRIQEKIDPRAL